MTQVLSDIPTISWMPRNTSGEMQSRKITILNLLKQHRSLDYVDFNFKAMIVSSKTSISF